MSPLLTKEKLHKIYLHIFLQEKSLPQSDKDYLNHKINRHKKEITYYRHQLHKLKINKLVKLPCNVLTIRSVWITIFR